ncbi:MAG: hypothetical protein V9E99_08310 [Microthrixaceae bacterium]|jgi:phage tail-like protein|nr:hypothetical protein [Microthrixaceae bacterium]HMT25060.1 hypothetical protein [Microthrixaceae bacterium]
MRWSDLRARADIVGGRVLVWWRVDLDEGDSVDQIPPVVVRRKQRDFEYPERSSTGSADPMLAFASTDEFIAELVSAGGRHETVPLGPAELGTDTCTGEMHTVGSADGQAELLRWREVHTHDDAGRVVAAEVTVIDSGRGANGLESGVPWYYELGPAAADDPSPWRRRAIATPTAPRRTGAWLYDALPNIYRADDDTTTATGLPPWMPEVRGSHGQLRRFLDVVGCTLDHLRSRGVHLDRLHTLDDVDARFLPELASWVGWDLAIDRPIPQQRHEVRHAARLYSMTGTLPGCAIWTERLVGWRPAVHEFWPNVFFTNHVGDATVPLDNGSFTVDTGDPAALAALGTRTDTAAYTHDASPDGRYALDKVGLFVTPEPSQTAVEVDALRRRLLDNQHVFLPANVRAVVVIEADDDEVHEEVVVAVTSSTDQI